MVKSVAKGLKLNVTRFLVLIPFFVEVTRKKPVGGGGGGGGGVSYTLTEISVFFKKAKFTLFKSIIFI